MKKPLERLAIGNWRFGKFLPDRFSPFATCFSSTGQSLIETIIAIFILTTGLAAGLALAVYSFSASSDIAEKISATGLVREGIEVIRRMRDSNWLADTLTDCGTEGQCYANWLDENYDIRGDGTSVGKAYRMVFDPTSNNEDKWKLEEAPGTPSVNYYRLYSQTTSLSHTVTASPTVFFRKINIIYDQTTPPYTLTSPLVLIRSTVWWYGKNCPQITDISSPSDTQCKIINEEYLTNWRNY